MSKMSVFVKGSLIAAVVALAFSSVAFAKGKNTKAPTAPATSSQVSMQLIQNSWKDELAWLNIDNAVLSRIDQVVERVASRLDKDAGKHPERLSTKLEVMFNETQSLLSKAESVASAHAGFDASGAVTDQSQALKSVQALGAYLDELRGTLLYRLAHMI